MLRLSTAIGRLFGLWLVNLPCLEDQTGRGSRRGSLVKELCVPNRFLEYNYRIIRFRFRIPHFVLSRHGLVTWFRRHSCLSIIDYYEPAGYLLEKARWKPHLLLFNGDKLSNFYVKCYSNLQSAMQSYSWASNIWLEEINLLKVKSNLFRTL